MFHAKGTVTAGNSSQMSDGAAAAVVMSDERAKQLGLKPLARFVAYATAGCLPEEMGIGPVYAIPKALKLAGLTLDHLNGHLHFHLHPVIFEHIKKHYRTWGVRAMRLTREPLMINLRLAAGRYFYRTSHAFIFDKLSSGAAPALARRGIKHADLTFGLLQNGRMDEKYLLRLVENLFPGTFEIFCHPDEDEHVHELEALLSPKVKELIRQRGIELIRYSDL